MQGFAAWVGWPLWLAGALAVAAAAVALGAWLLLRARHHAAGGEPPVRLTPYHGPPGETLREVPLPAPLQSRLNTLLASLPAEARAPLNADAGTAPVRVEATFSRHVWAAVTAETGSPLGSAASPAPGLGRDWSSLAEQAGHLRTLRRYGGVPLDLVMDVATFLLVEDYLQDIQTHLHRLRGDLTAVRAWLEQERQSRLASVHQYLQTLLASARPGQGTDAAQAAHLEAVELDLLQLVESARLRAREAAGRLEGKTDWRGLRSNALTRHVAEAVEAARTFAHESSVRLMALRMRLVLMETARALGADPALTGGRTAHLREQVREATADIARFRQSTRAGADRLRGRLVTARGVSSQREKLVAEVEQALAAPEAEADRLDTLLTAPHVPGPRSVVLEAAPDQGIVRLLLREASDPP